jgi:hypothetical protein
MNFLFHLLRFDLDLMAIPLQYFQIDLFLDHFDKIHFQVLDIDLLVY